MFASCICFCQLCCALLWFCDWSSVVLAWKMIQLSTWCVFIVQVCSGLIFIRVLLSLRITFLFTFLPVYVQLADLLPCSVLCSYANVDSSAWSVSVLLLVSCRVNAHCLDSLHNRMKPNWSVLRSKHRKGQTKRTLFTRTKHSMQISRVIHFFQATKQCLTVKRWNIRCRTRTLVRFWFHSIVFVSSAWKNFCQV